MTDPEALKALAAQPRPISLSLGLWAPTLTEQGFAPYLPDISAFEADDIAISRLHARGLLTYAQHVLAREKLAKRIKNSLRAISDPGTTDER